jgi:hypothetical protein
MRNRLVPFGRGAAIMTAILVGLALLPVQPALAILGFGISSSILRRTPHSGTSGNKTSALARRSFRSTTSS